MRLLLSFQLRILNLLVSCKSRMPNLIYAIWKARHKTKHAKQQPKANIREPWTNGLMDSTAPANSYANGNGFWMRLWLWMRVRMQIFRCLTWTFCAVCHWCPDTKMLMRRTLLSVSSSQVTATALETGISQKQKQKLKHCTAEICSLDSGSGYGVSAIAATKPTTLQLILSHRHRARYR